jgi:flagellar biosynthesis GTPase FlhF
MKNRALSTSVVTLTLIMMLAWLSGCATTGGNMSDSDRTRMEGATAGAVGGAIIGALVSKNKVQGALIGAAIGGLAGGAFGHIVAKRKESYASKEEALEQEIAWHQQFTQEVKANNRQLRQRIASYKRDIAQLKRQQISQQQKKTQLAKQSQQLTKEVNQAQKQLTVINEQLAESSRKQKQYGSNAQLRREIAKLKKERDVLRGHIKQLNAANNSLGV